MKVFRVVHGMNLRDALRIANVLGLRVEHCRRAGEFKVIAPRYRVVRVDNKRHDAPRCLTVLLKRFLL